MLTCFAIWVHRSRFCSGMKKESIPSVRLIAILTALCVACGCARQEAETASEPNAATVEDAGDTTPAQDDSRPLWDSLTDDDIATTGIAVLLDPVSSRGRLLAESGIACRFVDSVDAALETESPRVCLIDATPDNLAALVSAQEKLTAFTAAGGWIMLWGLTPEGLSHFNQIVGVDHLIRPFAMEEVELPIRADPIMKGVARRDVFMETGMMTPGVVPVMLRVSDAWTYVVDYDDIAPFCKFPDSDYWKAEAGTDIPGQPCYPRSMVNGLTYQWRWAFLIHLDRNEPTKWTVDLPREEEIVQFSVMPSMLGYEIGGLRLTFDDGSEPVDLEIKGVEERQDFPIASRKTTRMTIEVADHRKRGDKMQLVGIMNLWIKAKRSETFYERVQPLLNIGVLVEYPMEQGGIILNQIRAIDAEQNPGNAVKKRNILTQLLENLITASEGQMP